MNQELTELVFILDESGSMGGLQADTVGGFNTLLKEQREGKGRVLVSTVLFSHESRLLHDRIPVDQVPDMTLKDYRPMGCTALLDAIGETISRISTIHRYARSEDVPARTLFVITTDGMENASHTYTYDRVRQMVERQKSEQHWEFIFLGANIDAISTAARFGVDASHSANYECDSIGTQTNFRAISRAVSGFRASEAPCMDLGWKEEIDADYSSRHSRR